MAQIKFNSFGSTAAFGNFAPGDLLVCSDEQAKHFVEDAQCATYVKAAQNSQASAPAAPEKAPSKTAKKAAAAAAGPSEKAPDAE